LPLTGNPEQQFRIEAKTFIYKNVSRTKLPQKATYPPRRIANTTL